MPEWKTQTVEECLVRLPLAATPKLQTQDYRPSGRYPIIDQGQTRIAGWTDDQSGLIAQNLPVVVFGDHTRALKFVDFPFVRGADGTQVLKPKAGIDPLFFYYALRAIELPSRGYNRHFKALKEKEIEFPEEPEQLDIGRALNLVEDAVGLQDEELRAWERCKRVAMQTLFTYGLRRETQKETEAGPIPESWETPTVAEAVRAFRFERTKQIPRSAYGTSGRWPIVDQGQDFIAGFVDDESKIIRSQEPLIIFGDHTRIFKFVDFAFALGADGTKPLLASEGFVSKYLYHALCNLDVPARGYNRHYTVLSEMRIGKPDPKEQQEIVVLLDAIDGKINLHKRKRVVLDDLFKSLLHKLMTGEIQVSDLDLGALRMPSTQEVA